MRTWTMLLAVGVYVCTAFGVAACASWQDLIDRADSLSVAGEPDSAAAVAMMALSTALTEHGESDTTVELRLHRNGIARSYYFRDYLAAESLYVKVIYVVEKSGVSDSLSYVSVICDLADLYMNRNQYSKAKPLYELAINVRERHLGSEHIDVAHPLQGLGEAQWGAIAPEEAEACMRRSLAIREAVLGPENLEVAHSLYQLGLVVRAQARFSEAESLYLRVLTIRENLLGVEHPDVASTLNALGTTYQEHGQLSESEAYFNRALDIRTRLYGSDHKDVAEVLDGLAITYQEQGKLTAAEALYKRAIEIDEDVYGPDHPYVALKLNNLATLYHNQGRFDEVMPLCERALGIIRNAVGPEDPRLAAFMINLGEVYRVEGHYSKAEPLLIKASGILERVFGNVHPYLASSLNNLGALYWDQGNLDKAEPLFRRALEIREQCLGPEHEEVAVSLSNLASLYDMQGRYTEAEPLYRRALDIVEGVAGPDHPEIAVILSNLAGNYKDQGKLSYAESLYVQAMDMNERILGSAHPNVADCSEWLGLLHLEQGRYEEAEPLLERALLVMEEAWGPDHYEVAGNLESLSRLRYLQHRKSEAADLAARAVYVLHDSFAANSRVLSERDALTYAKFLRNSVDYYLTCFLEIEDYQPSDLHRTAHIMLSTKGYVSDGILDRQRSLVEEEDSTVVSLSKRLRSARFQISTLFVGGPGEDMESYRGQVDSLEHLANELESELSRYSASFRQRKDLADVSTARVQGLLPERAALIEYVKYDHLDPRYGTEFPKYLMCVISADMEPRIVSVGEASVIDSLVGEYRSHIARVASSGKSPNPVDNQKYKKICRKLSDLIWMPIESCLAESDLLFIAPDGALNMVSFAGLIDGQGGYLVEKWKVHYLSSGRDILRLEDVPDRSKGLFALGDPDFDAAPSDRLLVLAGHTTRNVRSGCGDLESLAVTPLPATRREVELVAATWVEATAEPLVVCLGPDASEERFKSEAPGRRVIHLATHGYFLEGACQPEEQNGGLERDMGFVGENPLLLSGLFLAGANLREEGEDDAAAEDGILTAYEVSSMDLGGTEMVVLSACETGLGKVEEGEGVSGLRRAFEVAGARTVISALWPVSDAPTADMMGQLYGRENESIPETMHRIQLDQINELRQSGQPDHPYLWAGFIAMGDWR